MTEEWRRTLYLALLARAVDDEYATDLRQAAKEAGASQAEIGHAEHLRSHMDNVQRIGG